MVIVVKATNPLNTTNRIVVSIPENAELEAGFGAWLKTLEVLATRTSSLLLFSGFEKSISEIPAFFSSNTSNLQIDFRVVNSSHPISEMAQIVTSQDLFVVIAARQRTLSFNHYFDHMPRDLARYYENKNFVIIYPEQRTVELQSLSSTLDGLDISPIQENIDRFAYLGNFKRKSAGNNHNSVTE
jgi:hypothetical protein